MSRRIVVVALVTTLATACGADAGQSQTTVTTAAPITSTTRATTTSHTSPITTSTTSASTTTGPPPSQFESSVGTVTADDLYASWRKGCPLEVEELRAVDVTYWELDGETHTGRLIVAADLTDDVIGIMNDLFEARFPIEGIEPVDVYDGDDNRSMAANNSSAFNCRLVTGGSSWSEHSYGRAIDINPLLNPYVRGGTVLPPEGDRYADRSLDVPGMIHDGDVAVEAFADRGWLWGGNWSGSKDYQHFSTTGR